MEVICSSSPLRRRNMKGQTKSPAMINAAAKQTELAKKRKNEAIKKMAMMINILVVFSFLTCVAIKKK